MRAAQDAAGSAAAPGCGVLGVTVLTSFDDAGLAASWGRDTVSVRDEVLRLADDCAVVIWGEFGRTPKISDIVGRDHWPQVNCALIAGGGMRHGQVIGATDRIAGEATERPVTFGEVYATLFRHLGIDVQQTTLTDLNGRPQYLVDGAALALPELA